MISSPPSSPSSSQSTLASKVIFLRSNATSVEFDPLPDFLKNTLLQIQLLPKKKLQQVFPIKKNRDHSKQKKSAAHLVKKTEP